jgi:hypothetical protein
MAAHLFGFQAGGSGELAPPEAGRSATRSLWALGAAEGNCPRSGRPKAHRKTTAKERSGQQSKLAAKKSTAGKLKVKRASPSGKRGNVETLPFFSGSRLERRRLIGGRPGDEALSGRLAAGEAAQPFAVAAPR